MTSTIDMTTIIQGSADLINRVYCCDCFDLMKQMPDKSVDLILCDPPYGINCSGGVGGGIIKGRQYDDNWDSVRPSKQYFEEILRISKNAIIFGGNFFTDLLPQNNHWIVWDKTGAIAFDNPYSECELLWTSFRKNTVKKYLCIQAGFIAEEKIRYHPTQKPIKLLKAILADYSQETDLIADFFAGSGSTLVACKEMGRRYLGCDISQKYVDITMRRLAQTILF